MDQPQLNWIANFIWGIADDVLRDVYESPKYRDIILPMTVIRRLDTVLEPTKQDVLSMKHMLDQQGIVHQDAALRKASEQAFYNTSSFTLRDLRSRAKAQQLKADFEAYLDGFSANVREILDKFEFRNQIPKLAEADILGYLIEKFLDNRLGDAIGAGLFIGGRQFPSHRRRVLGNTVPKQSASLSPDLSNLLGSGSHE